MAQRTGNHWFIDDHEPYLRDKMTIGQFVTGEKQIMCPHHYNRNSNRFSNISKQLGSDIDVSIQDIYHYARRLSHSALTPRHPPTEPISDDPPSVSSLPASLPASNSHPAGSYKAPNLRTSLASQRYKVQISINRVFRDRSPMPVRSVGEWFRNAQDTSLSCFQRRRLG